MDSASWPDIAWVSSSSRASSDWVVTVDDSGARYSVFPEATGLWLDTRLSFVAGVHRPAPRSEEVRTGALPVPTRHVVPE